MRMGGSQQVSTAFLKIGHALDADEAETRLKPKIINILKPRREGPRWSRTAFPSVGLHLAITGNKSKFNLFARFLRTYMSRGPRVIARER